MRFADIPAHDNIKSDLRAMVSSGRIPHALLLEGPAGIGKFSLARAFAQYIHCSNPTPDGDSCGKCPSCLQHQSFNHADTIYSFPILKTVAQYGVSDDLMPEWQKFLTDYPYMNFGQWQRMLDNPNGQPLIYVNESQNILRKFSTSSFTTRYKILLMWLPEKMHPDCANKLLKMIEEPMDDTLLIFTSDSPGEILSTIYSRLQRIKVRRLADNVVAEYLINQYNLSDADANSIASLCEGSISRAEEELSASSETKRFLELFISLMRNAYQRKIGALKTWSNDVNALGREGSIRFLSYCERMMRENFISNLRMPNLVALNEAEIAFCSKFSPFINENNVQQLVNEFSRARTDIAANGNGKIIFFDLAIQVILLLK